MELLLKLYKNSNRILIGLFLTFYSTFFFALVVFACAHLYDVITNGYRAAFFWELLGGIWIMATLFIVSYLFTRQFGLNCERLYLITIFLGLSINAFGWVAYLINHYVFKEAHSIWFELCLIPLGFLSGWFSNYREKKKFKT
jgi:hypothetical protein